MKPQVEIDKDCAEIEVTIRANDMTSEVSALELSKIRQVALFAPIG